MPNIHTPTPRPAQSARWHTIAACILAALCFLQAVRALRMAMKPLQKGTHDAVARHDESLNTLRSFLPATGEIGFLSDDTTEKSLYLAQYALAPLVVRPAREQAYLLTWYRNPNSTLPPEWKKLYTASATYGDGLQIYWQSGITPRSFFPDTQAVPATPEQHGWMWAVLLLLAPWMLTFVWLRSYLPQQNRYACLLAISLAFGLSVGVLSVLWTIGLLLLDDATGVLAHADRLVAIGCFALAWILYRQKLEQPKQTADLCTAAPLPSTTDTNAGYWQIALGVMVFLAIGTFVCQTLYHPHGEWDAWSIWNLRARFLFRGELDWRAGYAATYSHPDYPLLLPATVTRLWTQLGHDALWVPALIAFLFTAATTGLLVGLTAHFRDATTACLAGIVFLGATQTVEFASGQYADMPLAFYILATVAFFTQTHATTDPAQPTTTHADKPFALYGTCLCGLCAGLAAWTKNEGVLFLVCVAVVLGFGLVWRRGIRAAARGKLAFALGALPPLLLVVLYKLQTGASSDIINDKTLSALLTHVTDLSRYNVIFSHAARAFLVFGYGLLPLLALLTIANALLQKKTTSPDTPAAAPAFPETALILCLLAFGYFTIYLITPHDLAWHLRTSLLRLLLHLFPVGLFVTLTHRVYR